MKSEYPILADMTAFQGLSDNEMKFTWHYGCRDSELYSISKQSKISRLVKLMPEYIAKMGVEQYNDLVKGNLPPNILLAIKAWGEFEPSVRQEMNKYNERILGFMDKATTMPMPEQSDYREIKFFMDMQMNIAQNLPVVLESMEHGFGFKKKTDKKHKPKGILED